MLARLCLHSAAVSCGFFEATVGKIVLDSGCRDFANLRASFYSCDQARTVRFSWNRTIFLSKLESGGCVDGILARIVGYDHVFFTQKKSERGLVEPQIT
jgi:hypothetical protein